jgi:PKD repeat protein
MKNNFTTTTRKAIMLAAACTAMIVNQASAQSQEHTDAHCGSDIVMHRLYAQYPGLQQEAELKQQQALEEGKRNLQQNRSATPPTYIIPVVFHIVHDYGTENISDAQILDEMRILNEDFRKLNPDTSAIVPPFDTLAADAQIEFRLAQLDPEGNCTNGIDRIPSMETYVGDDGSKLNRWPRDKYLNVWVVKSMENGVAGYAYYPGAVDGFLYPFDGVIILQDYIGSIGTGAVGRSRALTHEIGHYLGLPHTWGSTNSPGVACGDDGILDTPQTMGWQTCNLTSNAVCTVGQPENVQNFMEYAYCSNMFTYGQRDVMHYSLNSSTGDRNNLWSNDNLAATGVLNVQPLCKPHADFEANRRMVCEGGSVQLFDASWSSNATSWNWTVSGPTQYTSTAQNPNFINLNTPGWYDVTLIASNATGSDTITKQNWIQVAPDAATFTSVYSEGFENPNVFYLGYVSNNRYGNGSFFHQSNWAAHTGTGSAMLNNYGNTVNGDIDELITPSYYLSYLTSIQLQFSYSYATSATAADLNTQVLKVYASVDCGQTWTVRWTKSGSQLANGGYFNTFYVPQNQNSWTTVNINLPALYAAPNVRFKFEFTSPEDGVGNNLFIDDINIVANGVGVEENSNGADFNVYPNPGDGNSTIAYALTEQSTVKADLYDISGRLVRNIYSGEQAAGNYTMPVADETNPLAPGTYLIQMMIGDKVSTRQYIVTSQE